MMRNGRPPRTPWPRRIHRWANSYSLGIVVGLWALVTYIGGAR